MVSKAEHALTASDTLHLLSTVVQGELSTLRPADVVRMQRKDSEHQGRKLQEQLGLLSDTADCKEPEVEEHEKHEDIQMYLDDTNSSHPSINKDMDMNDPDKAQDLEHTFATIDSMEGIGDNGCAPSLAWP
ncbi:hypothetical protein BDN71DRAFT_1435027 [Pleurotus eryngii]|uniref:Uncharacterized protein n=1 Tax=Pleurotus eryngii TaxID=5323 RepID=A0A9P5ZMX4_PLEER|nr:hypothetical protein BDN71DRAFT_1435027 [Pleurotus eryngii]